MRWKIIEMGGREVAVRPVTSEDEIQRCGDCSQKAELIVHEIEPPIPTPDYEGEIHTVWGWCGRCDIGG